MSMEVDSTQSLHFNLKLIPQGSRGLAVDELTRRLTTLHDELKQLEQETVEKSSLASVSKELVHSKILNHTNKTIQALVSCCLADILRLYAPDAPYSVKELKHVFSNFVAQFKLLSKTDDNAFPLRFYLLESLSTVKSVVIISDLDNAEQLSTKIFNVFFDAVSKGVPRNVQVCMTDILTQLVDEVGTLSPEVIELILEQFQKPSTPCNTMAIDLCRSCTDILQRHVCQYFSDTLITMSQNDGSQEDIDELERLHKLIQHVHSVVPDLLLNVVPQLEEEMKVDNYGVRKMATETMGAMFAEEGSTLFQRYPSIWKTWLSRRNDKAVVIRVQWLEKAGDIFKTHREHIDDLNECFKLKLSDPEEKVRTTTCEIINGLSIEQIVQEIQAPVLEQVALRCKDKKVLVRKAAMTTLGNIYNQAYHKMSNYPEIMTEKIKTIPDALFNCLYVDDIAVTMVLEQTVHDYIFPKDNDDACRVDRLVTVVSGLGPRSRTSFLAFIRKHINFANLMQQFITAKESENMQIETDDVQPEEKAKALIKHIAVQFPDRARVSNGLQRILELEDEEVWTLLQTCTDPDSSYTDVCQSKEQLVNKLRSISPAIAEALEPVLCRACPLILNKSSIPELFHILQTSRLERDNSRCERSKATQLILKEISTTKPTMYENFTHELVLNIANETDEMIVNDSLEILAQISTSSAKCIVLDSEVVEKLSKFACEGGQSLANHASTVISNVDDPDTCKRIIDNIFVELSWDHPHLLACLTSISVFALYSPLALTPHITSLVNFITQEVILQRTDAEDDNNPEWIEYENLEEASKQKVTCVEILKNYLLGSAGTVPDEGLTQRIFTLFWDLHDTSCDTAVSNKTSAAESSHLRLASAQAILKLTHFGVYRNELSVAKFERLGLTLQDTCYYVRSGFAETIMKGLQARQVHPRYLSLLFLCAHEPEEALLKQIKYFVQKQSFSSEDRTTILGSSLVRLIHLLAHHPDFTVSTEDLMIFSQYFEFFLSCAASSDNVSFLYHVAQKIKSSKDVVSDELSQNSYILSDLASLLIKRKCEETSWPLNAYQRHVALHSRLYKSLPSGAVQIETLRKSYLPAAFIKSFEETHGHKGGDKRSHGWMHAGGTGKRTRPN